MITGRGGGGGGGGGKGGGGGGGVEAPNTLQSNTIAQIVELLGEGEIVGLVDASGNPVTSTTIGEAVFFDQTQAVDNNGVGTFRGLTLDQRVGLPDQDHLTGVNQTETPISVNVQVKTGTGPVQRTIVDSSIDSVRVIVRLPALAQTDSNGNINPNSVAYHFEMRPSGGAWTTVVSQDLQNQKCTSPVERAHMIDLPAGGAPWDIRMVRDCDDSLVSTSQNDTWWESYVEIVKGKFIYPNTALVYVGVDASQFGTSLPARAYRVNGLKIDVPSNYDPIARTYTGIWDGTFTKAWTKNPAWIFYDLIVNNRYGLGEFVQAGLVDKWGLYAIAQYCDEMIPSGFKNPDGSDILEPRFTFTGIINSRAEAYKILQDVASAFRGMAYWSLGQVFASADMPTDPITTISPANVIGGLFKYSGTAMKARHSVALVTWYDPNDFFRPAIEVVQNDAMLQRFGWREIQINAIGCVSRGQAHRYGKWILDTEQNETETVEFTMSWDGYLQNEGQTLKPGDIVLIADPRKAGGVRAGGRLKTVTDDSHITIDAPFEPTTGITYSLNLVLPNGTLETKQISSFSSGNTVLALASPFSTTPAAGAMWSISGSDVNPRRYRIMAVQETQKNEFKITGLFNDPTKYARVEEGINLKPISYTRPKNIVPQVSGITSSENRYIQNGVYHSRLSINWTPPASDFALSQYAVTADSPLGFVDLNTTQTPGIDVYDAAPGSWVFHVVSINKLGYRSLPVDYTVTVEGWENLTAPIVTSLALVNTSGDPTTFNTNAPTISWVNQFPINTEPFSAENVVRVYDPVTGALLRTETLKGLTYTYSFDDNTNDGGPRRLLRFDVTIKSATGVESTAMTITVNNPVPAAITPTLVPSISALTIKYSSADADFAGAKIWLSQTNGFDPTTTTPAYVGANNSVTLPALDAGTWYVRVAGYDQFGTAGLSIGPQVSAYVSDVTETLTTEIPDFEQTLTDARTAAQQDVIEALATALADLTTQVMQTRDEVAIIQQNTTQSLSVAIDGANAGIVTEQEARITADAAEASARTTLSATVDTNTAAITTEETVRATADSALSASITSLSATVASNTAAINSEATTRATADSAISATVSSLTAVVGTKNQTFAQSTTPTATSIGDLWIDTGNGNVVKRWNGTAWVNLQDTGISINAAAITSEATARSTADSSLAGTISTLSATVNIKNQVFYQSTTPTATAVGDLWFDSGHNNKQYRWDGTSWVAVPDNNKITTFAQSTPPTANAVGDLWIDTGNGNVLKRWDGTAWDILQDTQIAANAAAITTEQTARATADSALASSITSLTSTVNVKTQTFFQSGTPTANAIGDIWVDTGNNNLAKRWNGSSWVSISDGNKVTTFAQSSPPTANAIGDIWIDTGNGNLIKRWDGASWAALQDGGIATNAANITSEATTRATADSVLSSQINTISSSINGNSSAVTISIASPAVITWNAHGLYAGQQVQFSTTGSLPTNIVAGTWYYVISTGLYTNTFRISATIEGAAINTTGSQSGTHTCTVLGVNATISSESLARVTADSALSTSISGVVASVGDISAGSTLKAVASAGSDGATAQVDWQITASYGGTFSLAGLQLAAFSSGVANWSRVRLYGDRIEIGVPGVTGGDFVAPFGIQTINGNPSIGLSPNIVPDNAITSRMMAQSAASKVSYFSTPDQASGTYTYTYWYNSGAGTDIYAPTFNCSGTGPVRVRFECFVRSSAINHIINVDVRFGGSVLKTVSVYTTNLADYYNSGQVIIDVLLDPSTLTVGDNTITAHLTADTSSGAQTIYVRGINFEVIEYKNTAYINGAITPSVSYCAAYNLNTTLTQTAANIGSADANRVVAIGVAWSSGYNIAPTVTVGGVQATYSGGGIDAGDEHIRIYWVKIPTGSTANIVLNMNGSPDYHEISLIVWKIVAGTATPVATWQGSPPSGNQAVHAGQQFIMLGFGDVSTAGFVGSWSGADTLTENVDAATTGSVPRRYAGFSMGLTHTGTWTITLGRASGGGGYIGAYALWQ